MKKLFYGAAALLMIFAASCDKSASDAKVFSKEASDSLSMALGEIAGNSLNANVSQMMASDSTVSKQQFLKGLQYGMAADTSAMFIQGLGVGIQLQNNIKYFRSMGADIDSRLVVETFKKAFLADSVPDQAAFALYQEQLRRWTDSLASAKRAYDRAVLESAPEARENAEKGENYIKAKMAQNDSVKVTESGLGYKIIAQGEGQKVNPEGRVSLKYVARTAGGKVIDRANGYPVSLNNRVPGLKEGVSMLNEGGKAEFYVPGKLAYGVDAPQNMGVGPNELVIYEVEVIPAE